MYSMPHTRGTAALPCPLDPIAKRSEGHHFRTGIVAVAAQADPGEPLAQMADHPFHQGQDLAEDSLGHLGGALAENSSGVDYDAMSEDWQHQTLDIVRNHVVATLQQGECLARAEEGLRASRAHA